MKPTVMLIGLGHLGGAVLDLLVREKGLGRIVCCSRDRESGAARCNLARVGGAAQGLSPRIDYRPLELGDAAAVAEAVDREAPELILSTATMQTWWLPQLLPPEAAAAIGRARFGPWLPVHLAPTLKLMRALRAAGYEGVTLTAPFPDVVNCILGRLDLAPTCGVGNIAELVPKVRLLAAERLRVPPDRVRVLLVAHHALEPAVYGGRLDAVPPFFLRVTIEGLDVTQQVGASELLLAPYPLPAGPAAASLTASCTVDLIRALLSAGETLLHAPAPGGLPGGYPVLAGDRRVRPAPIEGLAPEKAVAINDRSHRYDGIEQIEGDGTAVFTIESAGAMRDTLGYDCDRLRPDDAESRGEELIARFREYAGRHGVTIEATRDRGRR